MGAKDKNRETNTVGNTEVEIYTTPTCPFCIRAKHLLNKKGVMFKEIDVTDSDLRSKMKERANGRRTVPQIFINGEHVGGCDDLYDLEFDGDLDGKLGLG